MFLLPLFLFFHLEKLLICRCSSTITRDYFVISCYGTYWFLCTDVPLNLHLFYKLKSHFKSCGSSYWMHRPQTSLCNISIFAISCGIPKKVIVRQCSDTFLRQFDKRVATLQCLLRSLHISVQPLMRYGVQYLSNLQFSC